MTEIFEILEIKNHVDNLKAVVFDLDDTLYSEKEYVKSGYKKIAEVLPHIENVTERLWELFECGKPAIDELLKEEGLYAEEVKQMCLHAYRFQFPDINLYNGITQMLKDFRQQGLKIGVITDGRPEGQRAKIEALGLEPLVDHIIVTDEFGGPEFRKPNPLAFEKMKEVLNVEYSQMCYVGDNIKKDFIAPEQLGMKSIWFKNPDGLYVR